MDYVEGKLIFEYRGKIREIAYNSVSYGGENRLHLIDKKQCVHIFDLIEGKWRPIRPDDYPADFLDVLDWVIKQELVRKNNPRR